MSKVLTFYRTEPFQMEAKYTHKSDVPIPDTHIGKIIDRCISCQTMKKKEQNREVMPKKTARKE